jgi:hypothetical protein
MKTEYQYIKPINSFPVLIKYIKCFVFANKNLVVYGCPFTIILMEATAKITSKKGLLKLNGIWKIK